MEMRPASDQTAFVRSTLQAGGADDGKASAQDALAMGADRERRRIEFRSSLTRARAAQARMESRGIAKHALQQLSAGFMERRPARMMADLANAQ